MCSKSLCMLWSNPPREKQCLNVKIERWTNSRFVWQFIQRAGNYLTLQYLHLTSQHMHHSDNFSIDPIRSEKIRSEALLNVVSDHKMIYIFVVNNIKCCMFLICVLFSDFFKMEGRSDPVRSDPKKSNMMLLSGTNPLNYTELLYLCNI